MVDLEELATGLEKALEYERVKIHYTNFSDGFLKKFISKETREEAISKWVSLAGGKDGNGEFKEVILIDDNGEQVDIVPPLVSPDISDVVRNSNIDATIKSSNQKVEVYGASGANELNYNMMMASKNISEDINSAWDELIKKYVLLKPNKKKDEVIVDDDDGVEESY